MNLRKEFFRVTLDQIEQFARQRGVTVQFTKLAEAKEYRETVSLRQRQESSPEAAPKVEVFPQQLFGEGSAVAG